MLLATLFFRRAEANELARAQACYRRICRALGLRWAPLASVGAAWPRWWCHTQAFWRPVLLWPPHGGRIFPLLPPLPRLADMFVR